MRFYELLLSCTECGIIVCIDCHEVRLNGNLAYQGSSATYKSKRRRIESENFDSHYWPFCKGIFFSKALLQTENPLFSVFLTISQNFVSYSRGPFILN